MPHKNIKAKKEYHKKYFKKYYHKNKNMIMKRIVERTKNLRQKALMLLGRECIKCGFNDARALQIDHIRGGGRKEINAKGNGETYYLGILRSIAIEENKYQLLCANCNWIKRIENKEGKISKFVI